MKKKNSSLQGKSRSRLLAAVSTQVEALEGRQYFASIAGALFNDANGNHQRDAGEAIFANRKVYLDINGTGAFVASDPVATTDATGAYTFNSVAAGNYLVRPLLVADEVISSPVWGGKYFLPLSGSQVSTGNDFGLISVSAATKFNVGSNLFVAGSSAGLQTLSAYQSDGSVNVAFGTLGAITLPGTVSGTPVAMSASGANFIVSYPNQTVTLSATGAVISIQQTGTVTVNAPTALSANATSATTVVVSFTDNASNETSHVLQRAASASGPWNTVATLPGNLTTGAASITDTTTVANTTYFYRVYALSGGTQSTTAGPVSVTTPVVVTPVGASISGSLFNDTNGNRLRDAGETSIAGQQVYVDLQGIGSFVAGDPVMTTDSNGRFTFSGLTAGNYLIRPLLLANQVVTSPLWGGKYFHAVAANQVLTGDDFGLAAPSTGNFAITGGRILAGVSGGLATISAFLVDGTTNISFGTYGQVTLPNTVTGTPTSAASQGNGNIVINYPTVTVTLSSTGTLLSVVGSVTVTVNAPTGLATGAVTQTSVALSLIDNNTNETATIIQRAASASGPWTTITTLGATATTGTRSFTDTTVAANTTYFYQAYAVNGSTLSSINGPISVTTPAVVVNTAASISGTIFNDINGNGIQDAGENAINGAQAYLDINGLGSYVAADPLATADANGNYTFNNLQPGFYLVRLMPVNGKVVSAPLWGGKYFLSLSANQIVTGDNFGVQTLGVNVMMTNGQIISASTAAGSNQLILSRYNADTSIDVTFGTLGSITIPTVIGTPTGISAIVNGNIVVTYSNDSVTFSSTGVLSASRALRSPANLVGTPTTLTSNTLKFVDNNTNAHSILIERSTDGGTTWSSLASLVSVVAGNTITYTDNTATAGQRYAYRVVAVQNAVRSMPAGPAYVTTINSVPAAGAAWVPYAQLIGQDVVANQHPELNGSGVGLVIIDRGISYNHPQIGANKIVYQYNFRDGNTNGLDDYGHGTGVAGLIAGSGYTNNTQYNQGIAQGANIIDLKQESSAGVKQALQWCITHKAEYNIQVINLTDFVTDVLPGAWNPTIYFSELATLKGMGVFIATPVGNGEVLYGPNAPISGPSLSPDLMAIGGFNQSGGYYADSLRGPLVKLLAPASDVTMPYYLRNTTTPGYSPFDDLYNGTYTITPYAAGTSWASSYTSGCAVLLKQINPNFTVDQIQQIFITTGTPTLDPTNNVYYPRLNLAAAVAKAYTMV